MWQRLQQSYEVLPVRRRWKSLSWILPSRVRVFFILGSNWIIDFIFVVVGGFCDRTLDRNPVWQRLQQSYEVLPVRRRWKSLSWILPSRVLVFFSILGSNWIFDFIFRRRWRVLRSIDSPAGLDWPFSANVGQSETKKRTTPVERSGADAAVRAFAFQEEDDFFGARRQR